MPRSWFDWCVQYVSPSFSNTSWYGSGEIGHWNNDIKKLSEPKSFCFAEMSKGRRELVSKSAGSIWTTLVPHERKRREKFVSGRSCLSKINHDVCHRQVQYFGSEDQIIEADWLISALRSLERITMEGEHDDVIAGSIDLTWSHETKRTLRKRFISVLASSL